MTSILKNILLSVYMLGSAVGLYGQSHFGIKAGANLTNMRLVGYGLLGFQNLDPALSGNETTVVPTKTTLRVAAGAYYFYSISRHSGIQVDLLYMGMGIRDGMKPDYISLPVSYCYVLNDRISFSIGPYAALKFGGDDYVKRYLKQMDYGATLGGEVSLTKRIASGVKYYYGLSNIHEANWIKTCENRAFQFYTAYKFLKK